MDGIIASSMVENSPIHSPQVHIHVLADSSSPRIHSLAAAITKGEGELSSLRNALSSLESSLSMEKLKIDEYKSQKNKENKSLMSKLKEERSQRRCLRDELAYASSIIERQSIEISDLTRAVRESHLLVERLNQTLVIKDSEREEAHSENDRLTGKLHRVEEAVSFLKLELSREQYINAGQREQLDAARDAIEQQANALASTKEGEKKMEEEICALVQEQQMQRKESEKLQKIIQTTQTRLQEAIEALAHSSARFRAITGEKRDLMQQIRDLKRKDSMQVAQIAALRNELDEMQWNVDAALKKFNAELHASASEKRIAVTEAERNREALVAVIRGFEEVSSQLSRRGQ